jgi:hypothetical protein
LAGRREIRYALVLFAECFLGNEKINAHASETLFSFSLSARDFSTAHKNGASRFSFCLLFAYTNPKIEKR